MRYPILKFVIWGSLFLLSAACLASIEWTGLGSNDSWNTHANWTPANVPSSTDLVLLRGQVASGNNSPIVERDVTAYAQGLYIGYNSIELPAELIIDAGNCYVGNNGANIGFVADGKITVLGGVFESAGEVSLGRGNQWGYGNGVLEVHGGIVRTNTISFGEYSPDYAGASGQLLLLGGIVEISTIERLDTTPNSWINIEGGKLIIDGDWTDEFAAWIDNSLVWGYSGSGKVIAEYDVTYPGRTVVTAVQTGQCCPSHQWWDDFPRLVSTNNLTTALNHQGNVCLNNGQQDPGWSLYGQKCTENPSQTNLFQNAGFKSIGYYETYGQSYCFIAELSFMSGSPEYNTIDHQHWSWAGYSGGEIIWIGNHNYFDNEIFARPWTRTHPLYGADPMRYPDGTIATGYLSGDDSDPRNSRVYDAGFCKDILGNLFYDYEANATINQDDGMGNPVGPIDGTLYMPDSGKYAGMLRFGKDPSCPYFDKYQYSSVNYAAGNGMDGIWTDNYGPWDSFGSRPVERAFGDWTVAEFRNYLSETFSDPELAAMGISDVTTFNVINYMKDKVTALGGNPNDIDDNQWGHISWQDDPVWQAFLIFKRKAGTEALSYYYDTTKRAAQDAGKNEFGIFGNDIPGQKIGWTRGNLDVVSSELSAGWNLVTGSRGYMLPPVGRFAPHYKAAREHAKSRFVNIWFYNTQYLDYLKHDPPMYNANEGVIWVLYSEMLATHTFPKHSPGNAKATGSEAINGDFFLFLAQVDGEFQNRYAVEEIGIYYSSSTMLNQYLPGGVIDFDNQPHQFGVWGWGTAMEQLQLQFRILPEWKLTAEDLSGLKLLVIPESIVFDSSRLAVLQDWVQAGGRLIVTGESGKRSGEPGNFAIYPGGYSLAGLTGISDISGAPATQMTALGSGQILYIKDNVGKDYFVDDAGRPGMLPAMSGYIDSALTGAEALIIEPVSGLDADVSLTVYEDLCDGKYFIDAVNFDIDLATDVINPTPQIVYNVNLPGWFENKDITVDVVSPKSNPSVSYAMLPGNQVEICLGSFKHYASVIIEAFNRPDIEGNGVVNFEDMSFFADNWGSEEDCCAMNNWCGQVDLNKDKVVDFDDLELLAGSWLDIF